MSMARGEQFNSLSIHGNHGLHVESCIRCSTENLDEEPDDQADEQECYTSEVPQPLDLEGKAWIVPVHLSGRFIHRPDVIVLVVVVAHGLVHLSDRASP